MPVNSYGQPVGAPVAWSGARAPHPTVLPGRWCTLTPLAREHADDLYAAIAPLGPAHWTYLGWDPPADPTAMGDLVNRISATPGWLTWAVLDPSGHAHGMLSFLRIDASAGSIEVGGIVFGATLTRTSAATEAVHLLARHAIDDLGFRRLEWKCDALNEPSRRAALRLGFRYEGCFRQALVYKGRNRDTAWFAIVDTEWPAVRAGHERWLDPANVDHAGQQLTQLQVRRAG